jgi:hypothetical protein
MNYRNVIVCFAFVMLVGSNAVLASNSVLSGIFDGSESSVATLPGNCDSGGELAYQEIRPVRVSASGTYTVVDALQTFGVDVIAVIYEGSFNPGSPLNNLLTPDGIDVADDVTLNAGTNYVLVVQRWCEQLREGAWSVTFSGPGEVTSDSVVSVPAMTEGSFSDSDPVVESDCGNSQYQESGPVRVAHSGTYYYTDISFFYAVDMCLQIFSAPFNPNNPGANRVAIIDDDGTAELQSGKDYYFVVQPLNLAEAGEFFYVFAPPAPFRISSAMSGGWFYPPTSGQGFLMDVFDSSNQLFLAWFTYDLQRPDDSVTAMIGDPGHRWMTALGPFDGNTAELKIYWNSGMIFDSANPPTEQTQDGEMTVEFSDCATGIVTYDLGSSGASGEVPIQRLANDAVPMCESLTTGPGQPGPL